MYPARNAMAASSLEGAPILACIPQQVAQRDGAASCTPCFIADMIRGNPGIKGGRMSGSRLAQLVPADLAQRGIRAGAVVGEIVRGEPGHFEVLAGAARSRT
jgi:hypothetical protein